MLLSLAAAPSGVDAQAPDQNESANEHARDGFWFNGGLGYGSLGCQDCSDREGGLSGTLSFGGTVSQKVLLGGSTFGWTKSEDGVRLTTSAATATIRFYPSAESGFYLLGGLGIGVVNLDVSGFGDASETGGAAALGLGVDVRIGDNVSLTPYLSGVGISFEDGDANFGQLGLSITTH
ncbi:MAG TPA: hypothetical protein VLL48_12170 [Longimicrobiales bacterium]|nr:hypothetical protein [Longimicrobiales bacterium]